MTNQLIEKVIAEIESHNSQGWSGQDGELCKMIRKSCVEIIRRIFAEPPAAEQSEALEVANKLDHGTLFAKDFWETRTKAAAMLRSQAAEVQELANMVADLSMETLDKGIEIERLHAKVFELENIIDGPFGIERVK